MGRQPRSSDPSERSGKPAESQDGTGGPSAEATPAHRVSGGSKQSRRDRDRQAQPPVRIVSDPPKREIVPRGGEQPQMKKETDSPSVSIGNISPERIALRAYELYQAGGYESGKEVEHWLEAERQLQAELNRRHDG
jgi:hypothetical protein